MHQESRANQYWMLNKFPTGHRPFREIPLGSWFMLEKITQTIEDLGPKTLGHPTSSGERVRDDNGLHAKRST